MARWSEVRASFRPNDLKGAAFVGLLLGLGTFWNGALVIAALLVLGTAIVWAPRRGDLVVCCAIATLLAMLEAKFFVHSGPAIVPRPFIGFLAAAVTPGGIATYYVALLGLLVPLLFIALWKLRPEGRWLLISIMAPIVFATTFKFTPDVSVNHKFVNVAVRMGAMFVALIIVRLFDSGRLARTAGIALCLVLIPTGAIDLISLWNYNTEKRYHDLGDPLIQWAVHSTDPKAVFAAPPVYHHLVYFTGRLSYLGVPYWAESAGYDAKRREALLTRIYEGGDAAEIARIAQAEGISYVIVDNVARGHFRRLREDVIRSHFPLVFSHAATQVYALRVGTI